MRTSIPIYRSRFSDVLPEKYGAFVSWEIGQRCKIGAVTTGTIASETMTHDEAPEIDGARGRGRWVREVLCDDDGQVHAVSEERLFDLE